MTGSKQRRSVAHLPEIRTAKIREGPTYEERVWQIDATVARLETLGVVVPRSSRFRKYRVVMAGIRSAQVVTVYVTRVAAPEDAVGINLSFFFDARDGEWPFLVARDLFVRPGDKLDAILDSHFPEATADKRDSLFSSPELKQFVHLVVNALLYATSLPLPLPVRESPLRRVQRGAKGRGDKKRARVAKAAS